MSVNADNRTPEQKEADYKPTYDKFEMIKLRKYLLKEYPTADDRSEVGFIISILEKTKEESLRRYHKLNQYRDKCKKAGEWLSSDDCQGGE